MVLHEGGLDGAIGEVVGGCAFEEVDLVVTGCCGSVVPVLGPEVALEIAIVKVYNPRWPLVADPRW